MADEPATHPPFSFLQKSTCGPKLPPRNPRGGKLARGTFSNPVPAAGSHCPMDMDDDTAERLSRNLPDGPKVPEAWQHEDMREGPSTRSNPSVSRKHREGRDRRELAHARQLDNLSLVSRMKVAE